MMGKILKLFPKSTRIKINFYREDLKHSRNIPLSKRLKMWKRGFRGIMYYYYDLENNDTKDYLSDLFTELSHPKNGHFTYILDNKLYLQYCLKDFPDQIPGYNFLIRDGKVLELQNEYRKFDMSIEIFKRIFREKGNEKMVGKIIGGSGGGGIFIFENMTDEKILINGENFTIKKGYEHFKKLNNMILSDYIEQHSYAKELNPTTVNSVRFTTAWDPEKGEPYIMYVIQKIGRSHMFGPDNGALGGFTTLVNMDSGVMEKIAILDKNSVTYQDDHPDSKISIPGRQIPHYKMIKERILEMCWNLNYIKFIGWDIVVTDDSFKVLEMNSNPDHYGPQLFHKLMKDERNKRFFSQFVTKENKRYFMK